MTITVQTSRLEGAAPTFSQKSGHADSLISDIQNATNQAVSALDAASIGGLGNVGNTLHELGGRVGASMQCFSDALQQTGQGLINAGKAFAHNDAQLTAMFNQLQQEFQTTVAPPPSKSHHSFWGRVGHDLSNWGKDSWHFFEKHSIIGRLEKGKPPIDPSEPIIKNPFEDPIEAPIEVPVG